MNGDIPEIYWFLFWIGALAFVMVLGSCLMVLFSRANMKALTLLKLYAEKGIDPPPTLAELLAKPAPGRS